MTHPADPAGRPGDVPSYGHEAPYGPPPGGGATEDPASSSAGATGAPSAGADAAAPGTGAAHPAAGGYAPPGPAPAPGAPPAYGAATPGGPGYDGPAYGGPAYGGPTYGGPAYGGRTPPGGPTAYAGQPSHAGQTAYGAQAPYAGPTPYAGPGYWPRNDLGVWSLVLGIAGLVLACGFVTGIPAVVVGMNARRAIARGEANNDGMVTAGIVLGWVSIAFGVLLTVLLVLSFVAPLVLLGVTLPWASEMSGSGY